MPKYGNVLTIQSFDDKLKAGNLIFTFPFEINRQVLR